MIKSGTQKGASLDFRGNECSYNRISQENSLADPIVLCMYVHGITLVGMGPPARITVWWGRLFSAKRCSQGEPVGAKKSPSSSLAKPCALAGECIHQAEAAGFVALVLICTVAPPSLRARL